MRPLFLSMKFFFSLLLYEEMNEMIFVKLAIMIIQRKRTQMDLDGILSLVGEFDIR
jgi:hypothetical protein